MDRFRIRRNCRNRIPHRLPQFYYRNFVAFPAENRTNKQNMHRKTILDFVNKSDTHTIWLNVFELAAIIGHNDDNQPQKQNKQKQTKK